MLDIRYEGDSAEIEASGSDIDGVHPAAVDIGAARERSTEHLQSPVWRG